jgi:hypothetical protein
MAKPKKGLYTLFELDEYEVVPAPSYGVMVTVHKVIAVNLTLDEALEEAGQQRLNHQKKCSIREQA